LPKNNNKNKFHFALEVSGGGAQGAFAWGALTRLLEENRFRFPVGSGTSAGAMNLRPLAMAFNQHGGWTDTARTQAIEGLDHLWNHIMDGHQSGSHVRTVAHMMDAHKTLFGDYLLVKMMHEMGKKMVSPVVQETYYQALADYLRDSNYAPDELKSSRFMTLYINAVDQFGREHICTGEQLTRDKFLASAALPGVIKPVSDGRLLLADGALKSNPNMDVTEIHRDEIDAHILITPNQPKGDIRLRHQSDIPQSELLETNGLVLHQVFDQVALRQHDYETGKTNIPTLCIYPEGAAPVPQKKKLSTDPLFILEQKQQGYEQADLVIAKSLSGKTPVPNLSVEDIRRIAQKNSRRPVAA